MSVEHVGADLSLPAGVPLDVAARLRKIVLRLAELAGEERGLEASLWETRPRSGLFARTITSWSLRRRAGQLAREVEQLERKLAEGMDEHDALRLAEQRGELKGLRAGEAVWRERGDRMRALAEPLNSLRTERRLLEQRCLALSQAAGEAAGHAGSNGASEPGRGSAGSESR